METSGVGEAKAPAAATDARMSELKETMSVIFTMLEECPCSERIALLL